MINPSKVSRTEQTYPVNLLTFNSAKSFDEVVDDFEKQLGRFDQNQAMMSPAFSDYVQLTEGPSGLMIISMLEMGVLPALASSSTHARQYLVGNPLIASKMAAHAVAALYAPIRVLIYTRAHLYA